MSAHPILWPVGTGRMASRIREHGWAASPLGPIDRWPVELRTATMLVLDMTAPAALTWGEDAATIHNDAFLTAIGDRLGEPLVLHWREEADIAFIITETPIRLADGRVSGTLHLFAPVEPPTAYRARFVELQHRLRNILAIMRSILRRSLDDAQSARSYAEHLEGRLDAMARTQVLLMRRAGEGLDLEDLIRDELFAQAAEEPRFTIDGPDVELSPKAAEVVTMAIHELATNAIKFGAIGHAAAQLAIRWHVAMRGDRQWLTITWTESGVPVAAGPPTRTGFGSETIAERIAYELEGEGSIEIRFGGVRATIAFPLVARPSILEAG